jgi:STE24 endopeptidase
MQVHRFGLPLAVGLAAVAAGAAMLALRPREGQIVPAEVEPRAYFSDEEQARARHFRGPQRVLTLTNVAVSAAALTLIVLRPPRRVRDALAHGPPYRTAAATAAGLSLGLTIVTLPVGAVMHDRGRDAGLVTQGWGDWLVDLAKAEAIGLPLAAAGGVLLLALVRRFPRRWWIAGAGAAIALSALFTYVAPVVLDPVFNRFERLPPGQLRSDVLDLARRSGVDVGEVYRVDASRRTTGINAYVTGLGSTKRVVLYDNLIDRFPREQIDSVVAHELAHVRHRDVARGLLWLAIVAPAGLYLAKRLAERWAPAEARLGEARATALGIPAIALALGVVSFGMSVTSNSLSRAVERRADAFALDMTRDPAAFIAMERRLAVDNVGDADPPGWWKLLSGTHPPAIERIGAAVTWARQNR